MNKYRLVYRCNLCGELTICGEGHPVPHEMLADLVGKVVRNQAMIGNPYLYNAPMHMIHYCRDGSVGLATFAGFKATDLA